MCYLYPYSMTALVTVLALILYAFVTAKVGMARGRYKISAPATIGDPDFERHYRVQANTLEQLVLFLPSLWLFSIYLSPEGAALLGYVWLIGRVLYARGYYLAGPKRMPGFVIAKLTSLVLLAGALTGIIMQMAR